MVKGFDAAGNRVLVPASKAAELADLGGRVATEKEVAEAAVQARYDARPTSAKVLGGINTALNLATGNPLVAGAAGSAPPDLAAYGGGVANALTLGGADATTRKIADAVGGKAAGDRYAEQRGQEKTAAPIATAAGEIVGLAGSAALGSAGSGAAAKFLPGAAVSALGNATEAAVARGLAGMATQGALGRAGLAAARLGAQGAVEGALYGAAQSVNEDVLGDHEVAADRVFAAAGMGALYGAVGGAALGGTGSLVKSGVGAATRSVGSGLARMGEASEAKLAAKAGAEEGAKAAVKTIEEAGASSANNVLRNSANDLAFDALGTTRKIADKINKTHGISTRAVGEYLNREILQSTEGALSFGRLAKNRADDLLPLIEANKALKGSAIGDVVAATPTRVNVSNVVGDADAIYRKMLSDPTQIQGAEAFRARVQQTFEAFNNGGKIAPDGTMALSDLYYGRAKLEGVAHEMGRKTAAEGAVKEWLRNLDGHLVDKLDEAATALGKGGEKEKLLALKRDYQLASWAEKAATDGAHRIAGNNIFGLREGVGAAVGFATGGALGAAATGIGGKLLRERGAGAGAILLSRVAEMGMVTRIMEGVDQRVGRAAKGLLTPVPARAVSSTNPIAVATRAQERLADLTSSPAAVANRAAVITQGMSTVAPNVAGRVAMNMTRALAFLNSKLPPARNVDPLAPTQQRSWTHSDAARFARYVEAAEDPAGVLDDVATGKVTPEAIETLRVLTPTLYRDLQVQTLDAIAEQLAKGQPIKYEARLKLGTLLGIQADPSQHPRVRAFLQGNITQAPAPAGGNMQQSPGAPASKPISIKTQHSAFDRLAESGPGRR